MIDHDARRAPDRRHTAAMASATAAVLVALVMLAVVPSCTSSSQSAPMPVQGSQPVSGPTLAPPSGAALPTDDFSALSQLYDPVLKASAVRLSRGYLEDEASGAYSRSSSGDHLALYVRPLRSFTGDEYAAAMVQIGALLSPDVLRRWRGLQSYDVCIEPWRPETDPTQGESVAQLTVKRPALDSVDWAHASLEDLLAATRLDQGIGVTARPPLLGAPAWVAADAGAEQRVGPARGSATSVPSR